MTQNSESEFAGYVPESLEEVEFLRAYDPSKYPITVITVDTVITRWVPDLGMTYGGCWKVLLIKRGNWPYKGWWALPGGFKDADETSEQAAAREVREEAGLDLQELKFSHVADEPGRDPRGPCLSLVFTATVVGDQEPFAGDDAVEVGWFSLDDALWVRDLAFDHREILKRAFR